MAGTEESRIAWRKSSASNSGDCVQVAVGRGWVLIRDSANRDGAVLRFSPAAWSAFTTRTRDSRVQLADTTLGFALVTGLQTSPGPVVRDRIELSTFRFSEGL
jgi:hypothetical protein